MAKIQASGLTEDERYMKEAIRQAKKAQALGEVPIGCVIVYEGKIIARGYNRRMVDHTTLAHAEIIAIPTVAIVVHELPVITAISAHMPHVANRNMFGNMTFIP